MFKNQVVVWFMSVGFLLGACKSPSQRIQENQADDSIVRDSLETTPPPCAGIDWSELKGNINPSSHPDFDAVPIALTRKPKIYLRKEALDALTSMAAAAKEAGFDIEVISATRSWEHQKNIWNRKWSSPKYMGFAPLERATKILEYSSMPGSSRHHWGTDVDLNALENTYFESGRGLALYEWLTAHADAFGFTQVYGDQSNGRTGYQEEKWHWSYWPLSSDYLRCYVSQPNDALFSGFQGAELSDTLGIIDRYVLGIDRPKEGTNR